MTLATISLSLTCLCSTIVQSQLVHESALRGRYDAANDDEYSSSMMSAASGGTGAAGLGFLGGGSLGILAPSAGAPGGVGGVAVGSGGVGSGSEGGGGSADAADAFGAQSQEEFLIAVKRRLKIETPLDETFWRPYARTSSEGRAPQKGNWTNFIFVAGAEGTGHHFVSRRQ